MASRNLRVRIAARLAPVGDADVALSILRKLFDDDPHYSPWWQIQGGSLSIDGVIKITDREADLLRKLELESED